MDPSTSNAETQTKPRKRRLALILGVALAAIAAVAVGVYLLWPSQVIVPDLRGATLTNAIAKLQALHLVLGHQTVKGDPAKATIVFAQSPPPGTAVPAESRVDLVVSEAPTVAVPALVGKSLNAAQRQLAAYSLQVGSLQWNARSRVMRNSVLQQFPAAGEKVRPGSTVNLIVSGVPQRTTQMAAPSIPQSGTAQTATTPGQIANIGGAWHDSGGAVVRIQQNGTTLRYTAHSGVGNCQGNGVITGANFQTSYSCASIIGSRTSGRCAGTVYANGNIFRLQCLDSLMGRTNDTFSR